MIIIINKYSRTIFVFILLQCFLLNLNAQKNNTGTFELLSGVRYRITPVHVNKKYTSSVIDQNPVLLQEDKHLSGLSFCLGLNYFFTNRIFINYEGYIRYDEFVSTIDSVTPTISESKKLMLDHQFSLQYNLVQAERLIVSSGLGISFNNQNTEYSFSRAVYNPQLGKYVITDGVDDYTFTTLDLPIIVKFRNNVELGLKTSHTLKHKFLLHDQLLLFSLSAKYNFRLNKK